MSIPQRNYKPGSQDNCLTPPEATRLLIPWLKKLGVEKIWEPACGEGLLSQTLYDSGFEVITTDIRSGEDFLTTEVWPFDAIVTNPPFSLDYAFAERCMSFGKPWALLMKDNRGSVERFRQAAWTWDNGIAYPEYECLVPSTRISFKMPHKGWFTERKDKAGNVIGIKNNSAQFQTVWYCWGFEIGYSQLRVPYQQVDRYALLREKGAQGLSERELERVVDAGLC